MLQWQNTTYIQFSCKETKKIQYNDLICSLYTAHVVHTLVYYQCVANLYLISNVNRQIETNIDVGKQFICVYARYMEYGVERELYERIFNSILNEEYTYFVCISWETEKEVKVIQIRRLDGQALIWGY